MSSLSVTLNTCSTSQTKRVHKLYKLVLKRFANYGTAPEICNAVFEVIFSNILKTMRAELVRVGSRSMY